MKKFRFDFEENGEKGFYEGEFPDGLTLEEEQMYITNQIEIIKNRNNPRENYMDMFNEFEKNLIRKWLDSPQYRRYQWLFPQPEGMSDKDYMFYIKDKKDEFIKILEDSKEIKVKKPRREKLN